MQKEKTIKEQLKGIVEDVYSDLQKALKEGTFYEWLDEQLDLRFEIDIDMELEGYFILISGGGPTVELFSHRNYTAIIGRWENEEYKIALSIDEDNEIYDFLNDIYEAKKVKA